VTEATAGSTLAFRATAGPSFEAPLSLKGTTRVKTVVYVSRVYAGESSSVRLVDLGDAPCLASLEEGREYLFVERLNDEGRAVVDRCSGTALWDPAFIRELGEGNRPEKPWAAISFIAALLLVVCLAILKSRSTKQPQKEKG